MVSATLFGFTIMSLITFKIFCGGDGERRYAPEDIPGANVIGKDEDDENEDECGTDLGPEFRVTECKSMLPAVLEVFLPLQEARCRM